MSIQKIRPQVNDFRKAIDSATDIVYDYFLKLKTKPMAFDSRQQAIHLLHKSKKTLITTRANPGADSVASALAFYLWLKKIGKTSAVAIGYEGLKKESRFNFLPNLNIVSQSLTANGRVIVEFDLAGHGLRGLTYNTVASRLFVNIMPSEGTLKLNPPVIKEAAYDYDLIVVVDAPDLESLGKIYDEHARFFYDTPIINIDHASDNEHFGAVNLVELTAGSSSEIIFNLLGQWRKDMIDADIATCLLCGIIAESRLWQAANITPRALACASELITLGGRREEIVKNLYGNKSLGRMQLAGRVLSRLRTEPENDWVWSHVSTTDFAETNTKENEIYSVIEDFFQHAPPAKLTALLMPAEESIKAIVVARERGFDLRQILAPLSARGSRQLVECFIPAETTEGAIAALKQVLTERVTAEELMPKF